MTSPSDMWIKGIGKKRGAPHVFLDAAQAARAGFAPGERFDVEVEGQRVTLVKRADGSRTVSVRRRADGEWPVIDINSKELLSVFDGMDAVRVVVSAGAVYLLPLASEAKKAERLARLRGKLSQGEPISMASLSHGGGILSHAIHQGLMDAGLEPRLEFINEIRDDLVEQAMRANDAWHEDTRALAAPMQEVVQDDWLMRSLPKVEILEMGLPCSGASKAGVAKRGLTKMEDHPEVGHLVYAALVIINRVQPAVMLLENVPDYAHTASAQILRHQLRDMGYVTHEAVLEGKDWGALENRVRWCLVATTKGVDFDFDQIRPTVRVVRRVQDVLDADIGRDHEAWRPMTHLKVKRERDEAKGSNFRMQYVAPGDTSVPTLRKGYHKGGSTDPLLRHPTDPELSRLFTEVEHALIKGVPPHLIKGMSKTTAHQLLGQGIVYDVFRSVGQRIGRALHQLHDTQRLDGEDDTTAAVSGAEESSVMRSRPRAAG